MIELEMKLRGTRGVERGMRAVAAASGVAVEFVAKDQLRLLLNDLTGARTTVPKTKKQGVQAIANDVRRAFQVLRPGDKIRPRRLRLSESDIDRHLQDARDPVTGRVRKRYGKHGSAHRPVIEEQQAKRLVRRASKTVGKLKGGFVDAADELASMTRGRATAPAWVRKAKATTSRVEDSFRGHTGNIAATNTVAYAERKLAPWADMHIRRRQKDVMGALWKRTEDLQRRFNAAQGAG